MKNKQNWEDKKPTEAQLKYWESMKGKRGKDTPRWKGQSATKESKHQWLVANYGKPACCANEDCSGKSEDYEWCLKTGREYSHNPDDYLWLCRSCHRKYDMTPDKKEQGIKNLAWYGRQDYWSLKYENCVDCGTTERKYRSNGRCTKCYYKIWKERYYEKK